MSKHIQIADNQSMTTNCFIFTEDPSNITLPINDNGNVLPGLDGEGVVQYNYKDVRLFDVVFDAMLQSEHDAGATTLIHELKDRKFKTTGNSYWLQLETHHGDTITGTVGNVVTVSGGGMTVWQYAGYDLVDINYESFYITSNNPTTFTVELDDRTPANDDCKVIDRTHNPLRQSEPLEIRILDVMAVLVPNSEEAIYNYTIKCQKV